MFVIVAFVIFSAALFTAGWFVWVVPQQAQNQQLLGRLREVRARTGTRQRASSDIVRREERSALAFVSDFFSWIGILRRLQEFIDQAALKYRAQDVFLVSLLAGMLTYAFLGFIGMSLFLLRVLLSFGAAAVPVSYIMHKRGRRLGKFEEQFPDAIDLFNRSMKAGHNIHTGLETVASEALEPVRGEFKKVIEELSLGSQLEAALHNLGSRVPLVDLKFFITGLILQRQTGANMVQVLENMSLLIRERLNLAEKMKAATAQQRFSAGLLCAMPLVLALGFWFLKREYIVLLYTDETGSKFLTYAIVSEIVGILVIRKIASPRF